MKPILVPLDFTTLSSHVLKYATVISKKLKLPLTLLHTHNFKEPDLVQSRNRYNDEIKELVKKKEDKLIALSKEVHQSTAMPCNYLLLKGVPSDVIVETAENLQPDLLIMGSDSLSSFERFLFDATSPKVFKEAKGKLLIIPENAAYSAFKNIAFATNFYDGDFENINYLLQLSEQNKSTFHLVHVVDQELNSTLEDYEIKEYAAKIKKMYPAVTMKIHMLEGSNIAKEILRFTLAQQIDLLAVAKTDKSPLEAFFSESVSKKLFKKTKVPLMVLRVDESLNDFF